MIDSIVIGSGNSRVVVPMSRDRDVRRIFANKLKSERFFTTNASFQRAKARGQRAMEASA